MSKGPIIKISLLLISMLTIMVGTPVSPALPALAVAFAGEPYADLLSRLVMTLPALFTVLGAPVAGILADRVGRKPLVLVSLVLYAVAGTSSFFAHSLLQILAGRAVLGLAVGGCITAAIALISDYYQGEERVRVLGYQAAFTTAGGVLFISLGGFLAELGWRFPFLIYLLALPISMLAALALHEPAASKPGTDARGGRGLPAGFLALVYLVALVGHICFFSAPIQLPFYLRETFGVGGVGTGLILSAGTAFASFVSFNYGRIRRRLSFGAILAFMYALLSLGYVILGLADAVWLLVVGLCLSGSAAGLLIPAINNLVSDITSSPNRGRAFGIITTSVFLGQFLAPIVMAPLVNRVPYGTFFWLLGIFLASASLLLVLGAALLNRYVAARAAQLRQQN